MSTPPGARSRRTLLASILFVDLVGFSRTTVSEQIEVKRALTSMLRKTFSVVPPADYRPFGKIADFGLANKRLSVKFLFAPGSTQFVTDPQVSGQYAMWLRTIATRTVNTPACLEIVGHTSASGSDAVNERISLQRAQYVKQRLDADAAALKTRTKAVGKGSQENLIGIGSDDGKARARPARRVQGRRLRLSCARRALRFG
jgi:outer membrane protein OmpA-like peptidoglycan-associated protein